jgi:hypothetical protein
MSTACNSELEHLRRENEGLRSRLNKLQAFADFNPDIAFILDQDGTWIDILSSRHHQLYRESDSCLAKRLHDILPGGYC